MTSEALPQNALQASGGNLPHTHGADLIGATISVYGAAEATWYVGKVQDFDADSGWHVVAYQDGDVRTEPLNDPLLKWERGNRSVVESETTTAPTVVALSESDREEVEGIDEVADEVEGIDDVVDAKPVVVECEAVAVAQVAIAQELPNGDSNGVPATAVAAAADAGSTNVPGTYTTSNPGVFQVKQVLAESDGMFLVRWEGCDADRDTWEPLSSFLDTTPIVLFRHSQAVAQTQAQVMDARLPLSTRRSPPPALHLSPPCLTSTPLLPSPRSRRGRPMHTTPDFPAAASPPPAASMRRGSSSQRKGSSSALG